MKPVLLTLALLAAGCIQTPTADVTLAPTGGHPDASASSQPPATPPESAAAGPAPITVHVATKVHDPGFLLFDSVACASPPTCDAGAHGTAYFDGQMKGAYSYHVVAEPRSDGTLLAHDRGWFVGSVEGCGVGAIAMEYWGNVSMSGFSPQARGLVVPSTEVVQAGSGTEGLSGLAGQLNGTFVFQNLVTKENDGELSGDLTCNGPIPAADDITLRTVEVKMDLYGAGGVLLPRSGNCDDVAARQCILEYSGIGYLSGDMNGSYTWNARSTPQQNGTVETIDDGWFAGAVKGCGSGAFGMHTVGWASAQAPPDRPVAYPDRMSIINNTATEGLRGIRGSVFGVTHVRDPVTRENEGHFEGQFQCAPEVARAASTRTIAVETDLYDPGFIQFSAMDCPRTAGLCEFSGKGIAYLTGAIEGSYPYYVHGHGAPDGRFYFEDDGWFSGKIKGCGSGSFGGQFKGWFDMSDFDTAAKGFRGHATFAIIPGSATPGLAGLSGAIGGDVTFHDLVLKENEGHFTGAYTCGTDGSGG